MSDLMKIVLVLSASGTALAAALALLRRLLKNRLPQALFYYLWLLVLLRLVVPVALPVPGLELTLPEPQPTEVQQPLEIDPELGTILQQTPVQPGDWEIVVSPGATVMGNGLPTPSVSSTPEPSAPAWYEQLWDFLCSHFVPLWLGGAAIHFLWFAVSYLRFCRGLKKTCTPLWEHEQAFLDDLRGGLQMEACRSPLAGTPMLVGMVRHRIILPDVAISTVELEYILRHELTHLRRRDLLYKWLAVAVTSFHWFNPLMPWLRREISRCCELSCDEAVIGSLDEGQKQQYGETLLSLAALHALPRAVPATTLCEEKKQLKERLVSIMQHKKATAIILLLSALLALLIAGCAAVLGPTLKPETITGSLTDAQQAPILENIRTWTEKNIEAQGTYALEYVHQPEKAYGVGSLSVFGWDSYVYDIHTGEIRLMDGTYPDSADLGHVQLVVREGETVRAFYTFHLTNGDPAKAASPFLALEQLAADYPEGKVTQLQWYRKHGQYLYIRVDFVSEGAGYCFESTSINGLSNVREYENALQREQGMTLPVLVKSLEAVVGWQESQSSQHDQENYNLGTWAPSWLRNMMNYGDFDEFEEMVVYDLATGETTLTEKPYTGSAQYGAFTLLYPAEDAQRWVYLVDDSGDHTLRAGALAVVTEDTPLESAHAHTVDDLGREVLMDMAMTVEKGTLVYIDNVEGANCEVTVLAGEPPRVQGTLNARLLSTDLTQSNQVILQDTDCYDDAGGTVVDTRSGVADILQQTVHWLQVVLPGGEEPFWVRRVDLSWTWPAAQSLTAWLEENYPDHTVLSTQPIQEKVVLLAGVTNPGAEGYQMLRAYVLDGAQNILAVSDGEPNFSAGLSAHGMTDGAITVLFGDTDDSVFDYRNDRRIPVNFTEVQVTLENGQTETFPITGDAPYLVVMEGVRQIKDVAFISGEDAFLYSDFYSAPVMPSAVPETMSAAAQKAYYMDFAMDWRVDFIPDFDWNSYQDTVSAQDFLMLTYYIHRDSLPEDGSMGAALVEQVMQNQFGIESIRHESLFKTWKWDAQKERYSPVAGGTAEEDLFDTVAFSAAERWVGGVPQTVYTVTLRRYGYPFVYGSENYDSLVNYIANEDAFYRDNVQFLLDQKGEQLKNGEISAFDAIRQLISEGNTSGFTKGVEIQLEYYMMEAGPRFLYKSQREFDFTPGEIYENAQYGYRLTLPACWGDDYRLIEDGDSVRIDTAWGGTLCSIFVRDAADFAEEHIPVPYRVLGQDERYVYLMYFASDVQYDPANAEQATAYLSMYQDLRYVPFEILSGGVSDLYTKTAAWLEQEFHRVYDPYYDIQELIISDWQENGNEATFHYTMTWLNYNRDPDIVPYIQEAKAKSQSSYETLYQDYLALKTGNHSFKITWNGDTPTLYSDVSVRGEPEWALTKIDDYILD